MKQRHVSVYWLLSALVCFGACKKIDSTYKEFLGPERIYVAKADSMHAYGGRNRVLLEWLLISDPKVATYKVFWNNGRDSAETQVQKTTNVDTVRLLLDQMAEGAYFFDVYAFDKEGNRSVKNTVYGKVYGTNYQHALLARGVRSVEVYDDAGTLKVNWTDPDEQFVSGQVRYKTFSGNDTTVDVKKSSESYTLLPSVASAFEYRSVFKPEVNALDSFYSDWTVQTLPEVDITNRVLSNARLPFRAAVWDGSAWGTLADWTVNAAARNKVINGTAYGSYQYQPSVQAGYFALAKYVVDPAIENGKVYQTFTLQKGKYAFYITRGSEAAATNYGNDPRYIVVAAGNTIPDIVSDMSRVSIAYKSFTTISAGETIRAEFTLEHETQISAGVLVSFTNATVTQYFRMSGLGILRLPD